MSKKGYGYFEIRELADGVYAAIGDQDGLCHSNAGIIDLGDRTLVLDTLTLPSYGEALATACRDLTGRDPSWIVLTHYHGDHWLGNQAFPLTTPILATPGMIPQLEQSMAQYQGILDDPNGFAKELADYASMTEAEENPGKRAGLQTNLARYRALYDEITNLKLVGANTLFESTLRLTGSKRSVELIEVRDNHTASDVYVKLPEDGVLFMGDLGFFDTIPFLGFADPIRWAATLRDFETSEIQTYVPGHGAVAGVNKVTQQRECIEAITDTVRSALAEGGEITEALGERLPEPFRGWATGGRFNLMSYQRVAACLEETGELG